ncbi:MAG: hypothetical protein CL696_13270 [Chloroflexi bacterium]|nr:hypothetical protein [Chloroflexota bacterium]
MAAWSSSLKTMRTMPSSTFCSGAGGLPGCLRRNRRRSSGDIAHTTPSLVILDAMLPQMDGFRTCRKIRECSQVPIIMVTTMDRDIDKVRGLEMGPMTISLGPSQPTN